VAEEKTIARPKMNLNKDMQPQHAPLFPDLDIVNEAAAPEL
jgi:hypothetical protein